jgi:hypothetical protein
MPSSNYLIMSTSEFIKSCKEKALANCDSLSMSATFDLLVVDFKGNRETKRHPAIQSGIKRMFKGEIGTLEQLQEFIQSI